MVAQKGCLREVLLHALVNAQVFGRFHRGTRGNGQLARASIPLNLAVEIHRLELQILADDLRKAIASKNIVLEDSAKLGRGNLIDHLYKKTVRPELIQPIFVTSHPIDLSPLARRNDTNPEITDRFQLVVNSWEVVNAYSELVDPVDQRQRFEEQARLKAGGDEDAMDSDDDYVLAMEHGMPPMSGWGMGIDRILALLTNQENLKDVILFPLMKPLDE